MARFHRYPPSSPLGEFSQSPTRQTKPPLSWLVATRCVTDARKRLVPRHVEHSVTNFRSLVGYELKVGAHTTHTRIYTYTYMYSIRPLFVPTNASPIYPDYTVSLSFAQRPEEQLSYLEARVRTILLCHAPLSYPPSLSPDHQSCSHPI